MSICACSRVHEPIRVVLTGGPGAGKTAVLGLVAQSFCRHVHVLHESAGIVFGGGFPREDGAPVRRAAQRAIYHVQRELEASVEGQALAVVLCDRGTVDGAAYWVGEDSLWSSVGTTLDAELARYAGVIHLRTPPASAYDHSNPLRVESASEAGEIDARIAVAWSTHPRRVVVEPTADFMSKAQQALVALREFLPECCRSHGLPNQR